jgi:hypothetical protein
MWKRSGAKLARGAVPLKCLSRDRRSEALSCGIDLSEIRCLKPVFTYFFGNFECLASLQYHPTWRQMAVALNCGEGETR